MIQIIGTIVGQDGVSTFINPLLNLKVAHENKYFPIVVTVEVGQEQTYIESTSEIIEGIVTPVEKEQKRFVAAQDLCTFIYGISGYSFDAIQELVKIDLQQKFPTINIK